MHAFRIALSATLILASITARIEAQDSRPESSPTTQPTSRPVNRLANEKSPYLRQHVHNPVAWWPWCEEAFAEAKKRNCVVFVSVGYSACHWCHVMEEESFDDEKTAELMNRLFVNIKIDREERPDLDGLLQEYIRVMSRSPGGWPASIWLTPDKQPIWAGTYYPNEPRHGSVSFTDISTQISDAWSKQSKEIMEGGDKIIAFLREHSTAPVDATMPSVDLVKKVSDFFLASEDKAFGGFESKPKFPRTAVHELLFLDARRNGRAAAKDAALRGLAAITRGGIRDHVGGGYHRYSTDEFWRVPHFEKMIYDQAQILEAFASAYQATGDDFWRIEAEDLLAATVRDFFDAKAGGFISSWDADSEKKEGTFYVWTKGELQSALSNEEFAILEFRSSITNDGNWHEMPGKNVIEALADHESVAKKFEIKETEARAAWSAIRQKLFAVREKRVKPAIDTKIVAEQSGMMIGALSRLALQGIARKQSTELAARTAELVWQKMRRADGTLYRRICDGEAAFDGVLGDYAWTARGFLLLFEATGDVRWVERSVAVATTMKKLFEDEKGGFFESAVGAKDITFRRRDPADGAVPSGKTIAIEVLAKLGALCDRKDFAQSAEKALKSTKTALDQVEAHGAFPSLAAVIPLVVEGPTEIVLLGDPASSSFAAMDAVIARHRPPHAVVCRMANLDARAAEKLIPLLVDRESTEGHATVWVCRNQTCTAPMTDPKELEKALTK
jgi:uncharacterized protein YyaL (SSP411 family)